MPHAAAALALAITHYGERHYLGDQASNKGGHSDYPVANSGKYGPNPSLYSVNHVISCVCACVNGRACSSSFLQSMKENLMP